MTYHRCGRCGVSVFSVVFLETGLRGHVEALRRGHGGIQKYALVPELPGISGVTPHVTAKGRGTFVAHACPAFSAASFERKRATQ